MYVQYIVIYAYCRSFPHSRLITGFVARLTRRVPLVEQELFTLPEHLSSPPVFSGVRVTRSVVLCVCFVLLYFFSFCHCVFCSSSIYGFGLPLWYLQTLHTNVFVRVLETMHVYCVLTTMPKSPKQLHIHVPYFKYRTVTSVVPIVLKDFFFPVRAIFIPFLTMTSRSM